MASARTETLAARDGGTAVFRHPAWLRMLAFEVWFFCYAKGAVPS
jgi:hypothetical protein